MQCKYESQARLQRDERERSMDLLPPRSKFPRKLFIASCMTRVGKHTSLLHERQYPAVTTT